MSDWSKVLNRSGSSSSRMPQSGLVPLVRRPGKSKIVRWKEQEPERRLMFYISQWGKRPEKCSLSFLMVPPMLVTSVGITHSNGASLNLFWQKCALHMYTSNYSENYTLYMDTLHPNLIWLRGGVVIHLHFTSLHILSRIYFTSLFSLCLHIFVLSFSQQ